MQFQATWDGAREYCKKMGMDLVSFADRKTFSQVIQHLRTTLTGRNKYLGHRKKKYKYIFSYNFRATCIQKKWVAKYEPSYFINFSVNFWTSGRWISGSEYSQLPAYKHIEKDVFKWSTNNEVIPTSFVIKSTTPGPCVNIYMGANKHEDYWVNECSQQFQFSIHVQLSAQLQKIRRFGRSRK